MELKCLSEKFVLTFGEGKLVPLEPVFDLAVRLCHHIFRVFSCEPLIDISMGQVVLKR